MSRASATLRTSNSRAERQAPRLLRDLSKPGDVAREGVRLTVARALFDSRPGARLPPDEGPQARKQRTNMKATTDLQRIDMNLRATRPTGPRR
jgi:hypothetical protein